MSRQTTVIEAGLNQSCLLCCRDVLLVYAGFYIRYMGMTKPVSYISEVLNQGPLSNVILFFRSPLYERSYRSYTCQ